ncbi:hypothetical protein F5Y15DRAFT_373347 [Xylariaceae sp. FL0016]|nr:hypothetical protein F5Y15DRAFT_373347 [Xylariaceae sp. FL0016]
MSIFPILVPPSSIQVGLRAVLGRSEKLLFATSTRQLRQLTTTRSTTTGLSCHEHVRSVNSAPLRVPKNIRTNTLLPQTQVRTLFRFLAITHYSNLPASYKDAEGIPFRREDLSQREVENIFGSHITTASANRLLRVIHGRRVAGTLEDPILAKNTAEYPMVDKRKALDYLRQHIPVDEIINAGLRAEDELLAIEENEGDDQQANEIRAEDHQERAQKATSQSRPSEPENIPEEAEAPTGRLPSRPTSDSVYGIGNFDRIRAERQEAEARRLEEERKAAEEELAKGVSGTLQTEQAKPRELSPRMQQWTANATSDLTAPPDMKAWERLGPTIALCICICVASVAFAYTYKPPRQSSRLWPDVPPAAATVLGLMLINACIFGLWCIPPFWATMNRYFIVVPGTPRAFQLIGAMFSHHKATHLLANLVTLWFFGTRLHDEIGRGDFLAIYFTSGAVGFTASLANLVLRRGFEYTTLGASGAIYGMIAAYFWMHKFDEFRIFNMPPEPISAPQGLAFLGIILGLHVLGLFRKGHNIDMMSHMAGMVTGIAGMELRKRHLESQARMRAERRKSAGILDKVIEKNKVIPPDAK